MTSAGKGPLAFQEKAPCVAGGSCKITACWMKRSSTIGMPRGAVREAPGASGAARGLVPPDAFGISTLFGSLGLASVAASRPA